MSYSGAMRFDPQDKILMGFDLSARGTEADRTTGPRHEHRLRRQSRSGILTLIHSDVQQVKGVLMKAARNGSVRTSLVLGLVIIMAGSAVAANIYDFTL